LPSTPCRGAEPARCLLQGGIDHQHEGGQHGPTATLRAGAPDPLAVQSQRADVGTGGGAGMGAGTAYGVGAGDGRIICSEAALGSSGAHPAAVVCTALYAEALPRGLSL
jgi:hypothetical protein